MIKRLNFRYIFKFKLTLLILVVIIILGIGLNSYSPIVYGKIIDEVTQGADHIFRIELLLFGVLNLAILTLSSLESIMAEYLINKVTMYCQKKLYGNVIRARFCDLENMDLGSLISNLTADIAEIIGFNINAITTLIFMIMNVIFPFVLIFFINKKLALITMLFLPIQTLVYLVFKKKKKEFHIISKNLDDQYYQYIVDSVDNIPNIKLYKIEKYFESKFGDIAFKSYNTTFKKSILNTLISGINEISLNIFSLIIIYCSARLISLNEFSIGGLVSFGIYSNRLFEGIDSLQKLKLNEQEIDVSVERLNAIESLTLDNYESSEVLRKVDRIFFEKVFFAYDAGESDVLKGLTLQISGNGFYSIVGANGSGKTTIFKLLVRFYRPQKGTIFMNESSYEKLTERDIRSKITYVQKKAFIVEGSILDNIRLDKDISEEKIINICDKVGLKEFIDTLPKGLHTHLSSNGQEVSSGILQKLNFARAILHKSDIMIFDEISSDLDVSSEVKLCQIMKELGENRIVISISHRINAISMSDYIYYLSDGKVESEGEFNELIKNSNSFKKMLSLG